MKKNIEMIEQTLDGIELTEANRRFVNWISDWDLWTVNQFIEIIKRCRENSRFCGEGREREKYESNRYCKTCR